MSNIADAWVRVTDATALMTGTGKDDVHLLIVLHVRTRRCGAFNSTESPPLREAMCEAA